MKQAPEVWKTPKKKGWVGVVTPTHPFFSVILSMLKSYVA